MAAEECSRDFVGLADLPQHASAFGVGFSLAGEVLNPRQMFPGALLSLLRYPFFFSSDVRCPSGLAPRASGRSRNEDINHAAPVVFGGQFPH